MNIYCVNPDKMFTFTSHNLFDAAVSLVLYLQWTIYVENLLKVEKFSTQSLKEASVLSEGGYMA